MSFMDFIVSKKKVLFCLGVLINLLPECLNALLEM